MGQKFPHSKLRECLYTIHHPHSNITLSQLRYKLMRRDSECAFEVLLDVKTQRHPSAKQKVLTKAFTHGGRRERKRCRGLKSEVSILD